jgi:hypothetical protein
MQGKEIRYRFMRATGLIGGFKTNPGYSGMQTPSVAAQAAGLTGECYENQAANRGSRRVGVGQASAANGSGSWDMPTRRELGRDRASPGSNVCTTRDD